MPLYHLSTESDTFLLGQLALYRRLDRQARALGAALTAEGAALLAQYEAEAARRWGGGAMSTTIAAPATHYLFVGERPSRRAVQIGASWHNGKLAACTLWRALEAIGLDPQDQGFCNIWMDAEPGEHDAAHEESALVLARVYLEYGGTIVGMGQTVCAWLDRHAIPHRTMIHPAARGAIRRRETYQAHVAAVLAGEGGAS